MAQTNPTGAPAPGHGPKKLNIYSRDESSGGPLSPTKFVITAAVIVLLVMLLLWAL